MSGTFEHAPLIEFILELRWTPGGGGPAGGIPPGLTITFGGFEERFFELLGEALSARGLSRAERLLPAGVPSTPSQLIWRWRPGPDYPRMAVVSAGMGALSVSALGDAYESWAAFRPQVVLLLEDLIRVRTMSGDTGPFNYLVMRYLNGFDSQLRGERSTADFISEVLGFRVDVPDCVGQLGTRSPASIGPITVQASGEDGVQWVLTAADGRRNGQQLAVLDMAGYVSNIVRPEVPVLMDRFDSLWRTLDGTFLTLTSKIHDMMGRRGSGEGSGV